MHALMMTDDIAILIWLPPLPKARGFLLQDGEAPPQTLNSGNRPYDTPYI